MAAMVAVVVSAACGSSSPPGADGSGHARQVYTVRAGQSDPGAPNIDFHAFYPDQVRVHPGDTIAFPNPGPEHTVTFGLTSEQSRPPTPLTRSGALNPLFFQPCVSSVGIASTTVSCPGALPQVTGSLLSHGVITPVAFTGQPWYSSGVFGDGTTFRLPVAGTAPPGDYPFLCLLHPPMHGVISVVRDDQPTQPQAALEAAGRSRFAADEREARAAASAPPTAAPGRVQAGLAVTEASVQSFFPQLITVRVGQAVTWTNSSYDPHVINLGEHLGTQDPRDFGPPTRPPGADYRSGLAVSGFIGGPSPARSYTLRFSAPGVYSYICPLHPPGMSGVVVVES
jgi:plastocyanin